MAAHHSHRPSNQERAREHTSTNAAASSATAAVATPSSIHNSALIGADQEDIVLLREKLNQIAVGRRLYACGDNQIDHMDDSGDEEEEFGSARRRRPAAGSGDHFRTFLPIGERPSTPPSSPQPRDVLRKHLRMKSFAPVHHVAAPRCAPSSTTEDNNSSDTASDEPLDGICVDGIEISPLPDAGVGADALPSHAIVRLSVPEHLCVVRSSSYSRLTKCPEGLRKRKSVHMDDKDLVNDGHSVVAPLKKSSSQVNVLSAAPAAVVCSLSTGGLGADRPDEEMEDVVGLDPPEGSPDNVASCS